MPGASDEGALTVDRLVDEVLDAMHGYTRDMDQVTDLAAPMGSGDTTFTVSEATQVSKGLVQIDDEMVYAKGIDAFGTATLYPWGRAQQGTTAAAHSVGAKVTMSPLYPRQRVRDHLYAVLREMHPDIAPVSEYYIDVNITRTNYPMPSDCYHVLRCEWHPIGPSQMWAPVRRWRQNKTATGIELELIGPAWPGSQRARTLYMKNLPDTLTANQDLAALGYPQDIHGVMVLGAVYRLLTFTEPSRLQVQSVESSSRAESTPAGATTNVAKSVYALYQQRLQELRFWFMERYGTGPKQTW